MQITFVPRLMNLITFGNLCKKVGIHSQGKLLLVFGTIIFLQRIKNSRHFYCQNLWTNNCTAVFVFLVTVLLLLLLGFLRGWRCFRKGDDGYCTK